MKEMWRKPLVLAVMLIVLYFAGLVLGIFAVSAYPVYYRQKSNLPLMARRVAREYLEGTDSALKQIAGSDMRLQIYDAGGNCLRNVIPDNFLPQTIPDTLFKKYLSSVLNGKEIFRLAYLTEKNDIIAVSGVPIKDQGSVVGAVFLVRNLKNLPEAYLGVAVYFTIFFWLTTYVIASNARRKKKLDKLQQTYIANVTHAFKTPIASIKALAETLCDGVEPDPDQQKVYYGMILREANRQHHMIQDVLELSKLQSNGMDFTKTTVRAAEVFDPVLNKYATLCDCMGISLHISEEISRLPPLYTNPACVRQLLEILLDNALKFVHEGGDIWVEAVCARNKATICVRDNGIGIAKEALPHVFERFYKCSHDFNESGSGLGLAIAKEIISGLKEKIWVESASGKGAAFFFTVRQK